MNNQLFIDFLSQEIKEPFEIISIYWNEFCFVLNVKINNEIEIKSIHIINLLNFMYEKHIELDNKVFKSIL